MDGKYQYSIDVIIQKRKSGFDLPHNGLFTGLAGGQDTIV
jgi:hypothetical protein